MKGPPTLGCATHCNKYTPCLTSAGLDIPELHEWLIPEAWRGGRAAFARAVARINQHELNSSKRAWLVSRLRSGKLALRVTGPVSDGFWVRVTVVLAHARFARAAGLPLSVAYRSPMDNYDDPTSHQDGWSQYFLPVNPTWPSEDLVAMTCAASAEIWSLAGAREQPPGARSSRGVVGSGAHGSPSPQPAVNAPPSWETLHAPSGGYAWRWDDVREQRRWRQQEAETIGLRPRPKFYAAAHAFWRANGLVMPRGRAGDIDADVQTTGESRREVVRSEKKVGSSAEVVLGVHLRGTDRNCAIEADGYVPLIRAFLCRWPASVIFAASDDERMLSALRTALIDLAPTQHWRLITLGEYVIRGRSPRPHIKSLNAAVHARSQYATAGANASNNVTGGRGGGAVRPSPAPRSWNATTAAALGSEALLDTILLSQSDFLLGSVSAMTSYAILLNPKLHEHSFLSDLWGQPLPNWTHACLR